MPTKWVIFAVDRCSASQSVNICGEAASSPGARAALASDTAREIIGDFAEIARATVSQAETEPEGEAAYAELVEFVRVSVQLMFEELHDARDAAGSTSLH